MADLGITAPDPTAFNPALAEVTPTEQGGAIVNFDGPAAPAPQKLAFDVNLTDLLTDQELGKLGNEVCSYVEEDERSRSEWRTTYARGLKLLGLTYEQRTEPWEGACGAYHPMLLESVIRFNAQAMMDLFPGAGPVKTQIIGRITDEKERQSGRVKQDLNWLLAEKISGYRDETDMMLFNLPMAGTTFRKWRFDKRRKVPAAEYVLPEHVVMPYTAASLESSDRFAIILPKTLNWIEARMADGFYRKVEIGSGIVKTDAVTEVKDKIEGKAQTNRADDFLHRLYECHILWDLEQDTEFETDGLPRHYVITIDSVSRKVLSIRRNWKQNDPTMERQVCLVQHKYMPGFGPYGIGLINILGGLTESSTSILRQLVDAGVLSNLPAGYKTKNARVKDDSSPIGPGEWRDVEVGMGTLKEAFFPLPYGEPSQVLLALLGLIVDEGRRIGSVADMKITDMTGQNMPVGTTLAIIERSMKVMSAVQQRLYNSFGAEYKVLAEIVHDFMGDDPYPFELDMRDKDRTRAMDYDDKVDVIPIADPNATTMAQRIMTIQAVIQLYQSMPSAGWNANNLARDFVTVLGSDKADYYLPPPEEVIPRDPVTENMDILTGKPVRAGIGQDHEAHITVHMSASQDPKIVEMLTNNPAAPAILSAASAHILEHLAFQYRQQIEEQLGVPLPPPGEPLPEDVEYNISQLAAKAADKLLQKNTAEQQQKEILDALEDPVIQNERRALDIKDKEADTKRMTALAKLDSEEANRIKDILITIFKEMSETERSTLQAEIQKGVEATNVQLRTAELASDLGQSQMSHIANLLVTRINDDREKEKIAAMRRKAN